MLFLGFFIFNVLLVTVGIVSKFGAFLGIIWTLRHVERRVLVLIWEGELPSVVGLMAFVKTRVFLYFIYVGFFT